MRTTLNIAEDALLAASHLAEREHLSLGDAVSEKHMAARALLDANVWVALFDDAHQFSARANEFIEARGAKIATCPLTENGVLRVMSLPSYGRRGGVGMQQVRERLRLACSTLDHEFWPDDITLRDDARVDFSRVQGHNQVTDLYLLALAVFRGGRLVTFDQAIALSSIHSAGARHLHLL
ncbi:MAG: PIN domain-containing protein [Pseudomonadota bacterium]|nr:PIN domain-containing protein [Pseudomonadota bacterium]